METSLVQQTYAFNEKLSKFHTKYFIRWDDNKREFVCDKTRKLCYIPWWISSFGGSLLFFITLFYQIVMQLVLKRVAMDLQMLSVSLLLAIDQLLSTGLNISLISTGKLMTQYYNEITHFHGNYFNSWSSYQEINGKIIRAHITNLIKGEKCDKVGLACLYIVVVLRSIPTSYLFTVVLFAKEPITFTAVDLASKADLNLISRIIVRIIAMFWGYLVMLELTRTLRIVLPFIIGATFMNHTLLIDINRAALSQRVKYYNELYWIHNHHEESAGWIVAIIMGVGYLISVLTGAISILGWKVLPITSYWLFPATWTIAIGVTLVALPFAAVSYEASVGVKRDLQWELCKMKSGAHRKYTKLKMKSLPPLGFMCGSFGVLTNGAKTGYFWAILKYTVDLLLLMTSFRRK
ncbi:unnamed protein product [Orchesella dallaii]|uniref:Odorant receptor n=1 Tax=Orchesella dallaii TaxID=48710 RepID=A0ABP1RN05_9HEXA